MKHPHSNIKKYVIKSIHRDRYFVAIHSFSPYYGTLPSAKHFNSYDEANEYAMNELFTDKSAFGIEFLPEIVSFVS